MKAIILKLYKDKYLFSVIVLFFIGLFLRLYKIYSFVTFLGDQGRDVIILKRIITFEHFPAIGPPTSIGQVYLGPFYYYFIAPWLWISNFDPIGPAIGIAIISSFSLIFSYFLLKDLFNKKTALYSVLFITFSSVIIEFSRFSWNPNLLPFFSLFYFYFIIKSQEKQNFLWYFLAGAFLSFSIQLHYLALFLGLPTLVFIFIQLFKNKSNLIKIIKGLLISSFSFILFSIPLIIFDLRHNYLNLNNFIKLSQASSGLNQNIIKTIYDSFYIFSSYIFTIELNKIIIYSLFSALIIFLIFYRKSKNNIKPTLLFFLLTLIGIAIYGGQKFPHYFGVIYIYFFIIISYFFAFISDGKFSKFLISAFFILYVYINAQGYVFLKGNGSNQINKARIIAKEIFDNISTNKFTITSLPGDYSDTTYRYFLEIWGKKPIEKDSLEKGKELFVVCEKECDPRNSAQWDIAYFAADKIEKVWSVSNVKIYKLIRN